jgi:hypothetical protein
MFASALLWFPVWVVRDLAMSARLIDASSRQTRFFGWFAPALAIVVAAHLAASWLRGAKLRYFLQPWAGVWWIAIAPFRPQRIATTFKNACEAVRDLRLSHYFRLGILGFLGGAAWLAGPSLLIATGRSLPLVGLIGVLWMMAVLLYLPFLQMRFASTGRWRALFEWRAVRRIARQAPLTATLVLYATVLLAVPPYVFKIEREPVGLSWLAALVFVVALLPLKLIWGAAYGIADRRLLPAAWPWLWSSRLLAIVPVTIYAAWIFLFPYVGWNGVRQLFEQHAFLLPAPSGPLP